MKNEVSLVNEDGVMCVRWQMPVNTLIQYRHILADCASILGCQEEHVPEKINNLLDQRQELMEKLRERNERV